MHLRRKDISDRADGITCSRISVQLSFVPGDFGIQEDSKANVCEENNDAYQDEASNDITLASVGVSVDHSHDGEEAEGETFQLQFKPWKHTRQRATGRRVFGGWSSKQPFRVGVGGRSSSAPPLAPERSGVERAPTNALAVASSQKRLRKMTRKKMTKKRQPSRR